MYKWIYLFKINIKKINQYMKNEIIEIRVVLQNGKLIIQYMEMI